MWSVKMFKSNFFYQYRYAHSKKKFHFKLAHY